jgi:hypothetical protein
MALPENALTTVEALAYELGVEAPMGAALAYFERTIAVASGAIERYCNRQFARATVTERVRGYGTQFLMVSRTPVLSISSITLNGEEQGYVAWADDCEAGLIRACSGGLWEDTSLLQSSPSPEGLPGTEAPDYAVVYVGGYVLPNDATEDSPRTLPPELENACLQTCVSLYRQKGRDQSIVSESLMSASVTYAGSTVNSGSGRGAGGVIPDAVLPQLAPFKRLV